ncbi:MAG: pirin family protein [Acidimicrobiia bacterium]
MTTHRHPAGIVDGIRTLEGEGFLVRRPFPNLRLDHLGPFLLLDEMGPSDNAPGEAKGAPDHPHRGFETVTYVLDGEVEHKDSVGNRGIIRPGDVQWMTAGSGIVHSEMPSGLIMREGGRLHGFQLWVNLPAEAKMRRPRYQDLTTTDLPTVELDGGSAVVIAGAPFGTHGPADTHLPITYFHFKLEPERETTVEVDRDSIAFVYVFRGSGDVGIGRGSIDAGQMAVFAPGGGRVRLGAGQEGLESLIGAAEPLREPVVRYGPFVMNTRAEIVKAFEDYQAGRLGQIEAERA